METFNLQNYETVKQRKKRFYADHPDGRIIVEAISPSPLEYAMYKATIYKDMENQKNGTPTSIGHALELRDITKPLNRYGKEYESVNYTSWQENTEESAIGRALDNAGYSGNDKCSREEMEKVKRHEEIKKEKGNIEEAIRELDKQTPDSIGATAKRLNYNYEWTNDEKLKLRDICSIKIAEFKEAAK